MSCNGATSTGSITPGPGCLAWPVTLWFVWAGERTSARTIGRQCIVWSKAHRGAVGRAPRPTPSPEGGGALRARAGQVHLHLPDRGAGGRPLRRPVRPHGAEPSLAHDGTSCRADQYGSV